jgi:hypothetical protein
MRQEKHNLITNFIIAKEYLRTHDECDMVLFYDRKLNLILTEIKPIKNKTTLIAKKLNSRHFTIKDRMLSLDDFSIKQGWMKISFDRN